MPRRENFAARRRRTTPRRRTLLIYCGGVQTEPAYFHAIRQRLRRHNVSIKIRQEGIAPDGLVRAAAAFRARSPVEFDDVWCVVDVDEFDIDTAVTVARQEGVNLAASNPCFELWLLLHHTDCRSYCNGCTDVHKRLLRHVPDYDKTYLKFDHFAGGAAEAVGRAKALEPTGTVHGMNPSSSVWRLVEQILEMR